MGASHRRSEGKTMGAATPCLKNKDGGDVLLRGRLPQLEDAATGPHRHSDPSFPRRRGKKLHGEEMGPQVPVESRLEGGE